MISRIRLPLIFIVSVFLVVSFPVGAQILPEPERDNPEKSASTDPLGRNSPRGTVHGFISAVAKQDYDLASQYMNLEEVSGQQEGERLAQVLQRLLDQGDLLPYARISGDSAGFADDNLPQDVDLVGSMVAGSENINVLVEATESPNGARIWLFSANTVAALADLAADQLPLIDKILPSFLKDRLIGGVPAGHWIAALLLMVLAYILSWTIIPVLTSTIRRYWKHAAEEPASGVIKALALPVRLYAAVWLFVVLTRELGISIILRQRFSGITVIIGIIAIVILLWRLSEFLGAFFRKRMIERGFTSGVSIVLFLQRAAKTAVIILGAIAILGVLGIDVTAGLAALGIGGIALALGAQKTMENLVGSVTLVADQPVRVGDFCKVGDIVGTVESIGMRSTRIRTLNRTIVTIPNGEFSSSKIENFAHRDRFWFHPVLNLRYETTPDQVRYLLVKLRSILYSHPMVSPEPARVRFLQLGATSLDLEIFAYINAPNYDVFLEVQEDLLLRIMDVVEASGSGFAFPSQTIYFARDGGLSQEKSSAAGRQVKKWIKNNELQIPQFDPDRIRELQNSIHYPPEGSVNRKERD